MPSSKGITIDDLEIIDLKTLKEAKGSKLPNSAEFGSHNIVEVEVPQEQSVRDFHPGKIKDKGIIYSEVKKTFPKASTHNARFSISELARKSLRIDQEESERIESEIKRRLDEQLDVLKQLVKKEGYEEGYSSGLEEGKQEVFDQSKPNLESLKKLVIGFDSMKKEIFKANEELIVRMVYRIAKSVLLKEIKEDKDYVFRLSESILEKLGTRENIKIFVSAKEFSSAQKLKEDLAQSFGELKNITIELDNQIDSGCRVETDFSEVDARLEVQIEEIAKTLGVKT